MNNERFQTIIFDLDGTIIDSAQGILNSAMYALHKMGIEDVERDSLYSFIGPPLRDSFRTFFKMNDEDSKKAVDYYREYYREKGVLEVSIYDGIAEVLKTLKQQGKQVMMGTSKPEIFARRIADHLDIAQYFDVIAGGDLEGKRDDKVSVLNYGLEQLGNPGSEEILMVGDRKFDVLGAAKLGIDTLGVLYGFGEQEELEQAGAKWIVENPMDIIEFLS
ncbi:MAG: HAD hydrolase-like protein [Eubacterium sp.]|nr:HAD hydrolase-like protein [Eubacterium sp.]